MGKYISSTSLQQRIGTTRLNGLCGSSGDAQETLLEGVIARAEALVESYAATRYAVPLQTCDLVSEWALRIAEHELYKRSPGDDAPQKIKDSYQDALQQLEAMSQGVLKLVSAVAQSPASASGASFSTASPGDAARFDNVSMRGF